MEDEYKVLKSDHDRIAQEDKKMMLEDKEKSNKS